MTNSADPDLHFRSQLIWIYTVCKGMVYQGSARQGLTSSFRIYKNECKKNNFFSAFVNSIGLTEELSLFVCNIALVKALFFNPKVLIFFLFLHENICYGYSLEVPH